MSKLLTKKSSIVGKGHISVLDFKETFSHCDEAVFFPFGYPPNEVSFLEVRVPGFQNFSHSIPNYWLHVSTKKKRFICECKLNYDKNSLYFKLNQVYLVSRQARELYYRLLSNPYKVNRKERKHISKRKRERELWAWAYWMRSKGIKKAIWDFSLNASHVRIIRQVKVLHQHFFWTL